MTDAAPEDGARFRQVLRGYDKHEVDAAIKRLQKEVDDLTAERDRVRGEPTAESAPPVDFDEFAKDVAEVLAAARHAADELTSRTEQEVAEQRLAAEAEATSIRAEASAEAERLVAEAERAAEEAVNNAEEDVRIVRAEAEREAHRLVATATKEAEETLRKARMEAEHIQAAAASERDRILGEAREAAESAQARARALEVRRDELLGELESVRATVARLEGEIDEKRTVLESAPEPEPEEVEPPDTAEYAGIRIIPARDDDDPDEGPVGDPVEALAVVEEVKRLHTTEPAGDVTPTAEPADEPAEEPEDQARSAEVLESTDAGPEVSPADDEASEEPPVDELGDLFAALRGGTADADPVTGRPEGVTDPESDETTVRDEPAEVDQGVTPVAHADEDADEAADERDRRLIPITNGALRGVKRELADAQNHALEGIRNAPDSWRPSRTELKDHFEPSLVVVRDQARRAGIAWALDRLGADVAVSGRSEGDGSAMAGDLGASIERALGRAADGSARSAEVSRVFRSWRSDTAERHLRSEAARAYHQGVRDAAHAAGAEVRLVVLRACAACAEAAEADEVPTPPLHDGCRCVLVPVTS